MFARLPLPRRSGKPPSRVLAAKLLIKVNLTENN
jgi:hypothetical protein